MNPVTARKTSGVKRIAPGPIGAWKVGARRAKDVQPGHGQERAQREAELDELEHGLEALRHEEERHDRELEQDRGGRDAFGALAAEDAQHGNVLADRHRHARADPGHGADGRDEADAR